MNIADLQLGYQLSASPVSVDTKAGVIRGATVAKSGVEAIGKYVYLDATGKPTRDVENAKSHVQVVTDEKTLDTLMAAAKTAGGRLKVRSDHSDLIADRAGYADNFQRVGDRVIADLHLLDSYRDRDIVLESSDKTPELLGLSIDMNPEFEIEGSRALMRIIDLFAVDIVDCGAITHDGMFLSQGVDKSRNDESTKLTNLSTMASDNSENILAAVNKLVEAQTAMSQMVQACMTKMSEGVTPKKEEVAKDGDGKQSAKTESEKFAADLKSLQEKQAVQTEKLATMEKERAALGLKASRGDVVAGAGGADSAGESSSKKEVPKTYEQVVSELSAENDKKAQGRMSRGQLHQTAMRAEPKLYAESLKRRGIVLN